MHSIEVVLIMLLAVIASSYLVRALPFSVPLPLAQIALGVLIAATLSDSTVELKSEIFLFVFLPPLLFLDGWRIPKTSLFHDKVTVISLAFGLVIFTVLGVGFLIYWLVPGMPLPVAFALAAVVSPTDPVAVSSIVSRCAMPKRLMHILEGESLLNDASGLVCFRFAVVAATTGLFSLGSASLTFLWMAVGGVALGIAVTLAISYAHFWLSRRWGEESGAAILTNLMIPFGAYLAAETFHASGILAAVAAGITMSYIELSGRAMAATRVQRTAVWDMARFALNGLMFVLLGEQLPAIVSRAMNTVGEAGEYGTSSVWLIVCALVITVALIGLRYVWVWVSLRLMLFFARRSGNRAGDEIVEVDSRVVPVMSLAGVRGAVTLAGVLSLPLVMKHDGSPFPARDQAIFLAAMVILISLVAASVLLPWLLRGRAMSVPEVSVEERKEENAIRAAAAAAIKAVEEAGHEMAVNDPDADEIGLYTQATQRVIETYRDRFADEPYAVDEGQFLRNADGIELKLRQIALKAERDTIARLAQTRHISDDVFRRLMDRIDFLSVAHHPETRHH
ncbi:MAG: Na+/H+ antiporter [Betaproteobacteria bacterium]|nr:Na+/H+ antiporter [Betaproteobacteria bacterium]